MTLPTDEKEANERYAHVSSDQTDGLRAHSQALHMLSVFAPVRSDSAPFVENAAWDTIEKSICQLVFRMDMKMLMNVLMHTSNYAFPFGIQHG